jgi:hypothetical protein
MDSKDRRTRGRSSWTREYGRETGDEPRSPRQPRFIRSPGSTWWRHRPRGHRVELIGPRTRLSVDGRIVQVLSRRKPGSPWQANTHFPTVGNAEAVIFVDLMRETAEYYLALASVVHEDVRSHHEAWLASVSERRPRNATLSTLRAVRAGEVFDHP